MKSTSSQHSRCRDVLYAALLNANVHIDDAERVNLWRKMHIFIFDTRPLSIKILRCRRVKTTRLLPQFCCICNRNQTLNGILNKWSQLHSSNAHQITQYEHPKLTHEEETPIETRARSPGTCCLGQVGASGWGTACRAGLLPSNRCRRCEGEVR